MSTTAETEAIDPDLEENSLEALKEEFYFQEIASGSQQKPFENKVFLDLLKDSGQDAVFQPLSNKPINTTFTSSVITSNNIWEN